MVLINSNVCLAEGNEKPNEREYIKLIEEGKTWEYIYGSGYYEWGDFSAFQMRFDGTEIRNGVEYHKLVYCGNLTTWYTKDRNVRPLVVSNLSDRPNDIDTYYLMREEDGKVYLYIKDLMDGKINPEDEVWIPEGGVEIVGDEAIIYDFTKEAGSIINNVFCNYRTFQSNIYPFDFSLWSCINIYVKSVSEIELNGKRSIKQVCVEDFYRYDRYSCIEGVGVDSFGFLPFIDIHPLTSGFDYSYYYLNCLYDADGEMIYKADGEYFKYIDIEELVRLADIDQPVIAPTIVRNNDGIKAENAVITLFDLSGRVMISGYETVSTSSLQPGVYIAKAESPSGISTLKIRID